MKRYEVIREIFNNCGGKWKIDSHFQDEWETDDIEKLLATWCGGTLPEHEVQELDEGTLIYTIMGEVRYRYSFTEF